MKERTVSHYRITGQLGTGAMGVVWEAVDTWLDRPVALKFLASHLVSNEAAKARFIREAKAAATLNHTNIATVYGIEETHEGVFISMELVRGTSLREAMDSGAISPDTATAITTQIGRGLAAAHERGIVHRDIKPANILINQDGKVKIVDFGLAKLVGAQRVTADGATVGTANYMSPEQATGEDVTHQADIWALGIIHYEMLTGKLPFQGANARAQIEAIVNDEPEPVSVAAPGTPANLDSILARALAKDPVHRYANVQDFMRALEDPDAPFATTKGLPVVDKPTKRIRFDLPRSPVIAAVVVAIALVAGFFGLSRRSSGEFRAGDYVLLTEFVDLGGTEDLHSVLRTALTIDIQQSRYVNIFTGKRLTDALGRMEMPAGEPVTAELGAELAMRESVPVVLTGSAGRVGDQVMIAVQLERPYSGEIVFATKVVAATEDELLPALDQISRSIREQLGEPVSAIRDSDKRLAQVTTSSLAALQSYSEGNRFFLAADWGEATPLLTRATEEDSTFAMAYAKLARIYFFSARTADALRYSHMAYRWRENLTHRERLYIEGEYYRYREEYHDAIVAMAALLDLHPDDLENRNNLTTTYLMTLRYDQALELLLRPAVGSQPNVYRTHTLATTYAGLGAFSEAVARFESVPADSPALLRAQLGIASSYLCDGNFAAAAAARDSLLAMAGTRGISADLMVAKGLPLLGRFEETLAHLEAAGLEAAEHGRSSQVAYSHLYSGMCEYRRGDDAAAISAFGRAVELWSGSRTLLCLGQAQARTGNFESAAEVLARLAELAEREPTRNNRNALLKLEAEIARQLGNHGQVVELLSSLLPTAMGDLEARYDLGRAHLAAGGLVEARECFEFIVANRYFTIVAGFPALWPLAEYHLGLVAAADGRPADARRRLETFLEIWSGADAGLAEVADATAKLAALSGG